MFNDAIIKCIKGRNKKNYGGINMPELNNDLGTKVESASFIDINGTTIIDQNIIGNVMDIPCCDGYYDGCGSGDSWPTISDR